jgi:hypothetical protein
MRFLQLLGAWSRRRLSALLSSTQAPLVEPRDKSAPARNAQARSRDLAQEEARKMLAQRQREPGRRKPGNVKPGEATRASMHGPLLEPLRDAARPQQPPSRKPSGPVVLAIEPVDPDRSVVEQDETEPMPFYTSAHERDEKAGRR